jgi:hypothetical protein
MLKYRIDSLRINQEIIKRIGYIFNDMSSSSIKVSDNFKFAIRLLLAVLRVMIALYFFFPQN